MIPRDKIMFLKIFGRQSIFRTITESSLKRPSSILPASRTSEVSRLPASASLRTKDLQTSSRPLDSGVSSLQQEFEPRAGNFKTSERGQSPGAVRDTNLDSPNVSDSFDLESVGYILSRIQEHRYNSQNYAYESKIFYL